MDEIPWYSEASLLAPGHVFCAGSLAQCVRKWRRLPAEHQVAAYIKLAHKFDGRETLSHEDVAVLASNNQIRDV
jgi:hypothetical protein